MAYPDQIRRPVQMERGGRVEPSAPKLLDLRDVLRLLRRRLRIVLSVIGFFTGASFLVAMLPLPQYTAVATLLIEGADPKVLQSEAVVSTPPQDRPIVATHIQILSAGTFLRGLINDLKLHEDPEFNPALPGGPRVRDHIETFIAEWFPGLLSLVKDGELSSDDQKEATLSQLLRKLEVEQSGEAYTVAVRVTSYDPNKAATIANAVADRYMQSRLDKRRGDTLRAASLLEARLEELRKRAAESDAAVAQFIQSEGVPKTPQEDPLIRQIDQLSTQLVLAEINRTQADAELQRVKQLMDDPGGQGGFLFTSPLLIELQREESELNRKRAELATVYGDRHPSIRNLQAELGSLRERQMAEISRIVSDYENKAKVSQAQEEQLRRRHQKLAAQARGQQIGAVKLRELERQAEADRAIYNSFLNRYKEVSEQAGMVKAGVSIVSKAEAPVASSSPKKYLLIGGTFSSSLVLAFMLAFIAEILDNNLRNARQVESILGMPTLAMVPLVRKRRLNGQSLHSYVISNPGSSMANALRGALLELLQSNLDKPPQVIIVTSALPGEGKTTLALGLAEMAGTNGKRAVIVDLDLHRPRVRALLGIPNEVPGVLEVLAGEEPLDLAVTKGGDQASFSAITVRRTAANASALLASQRMGELMVALRRRFDLIILDTPPTLAVGDARAVAGWADSMVFVVRWGKTKADAARAGLDALRDTPTALAGVVISQVDLKRHAKGAYGDAIQYYRRYAHYYQD